MESSAEVATALQLVGDTEQTADRALGDMFTRLGGAYQTQATLFRDHVRSCPTHIPLVRWTSPAPSQANEEALRFEDPIRDYVRYISAVKDVMAYRLETLTQLQTVK